MISSMTGFSRCSAEFSFGTFVWEIRSVNSRFLELNIRLPENLRQWESQVRECLQGTLTRGKIEATLKFTPGVELPFDFRINEQLLARLAQAASSVEKFFPQTVTNVFDILNWQGVLEIQQTHLDRIGSSLLALLDKALIDLVAMRQREGEKLKSFLQMNSQKVQKLVKVVSQHLPRMREQACEKVKSRFAELSLEVNAERLEQEMVWLLQRMDVAEEIQRLNSHLQELERILTQDQVVGRRLDFLMQELNREANTLGSKSLDSEITQSMIEIKVLIEQMREQVQNIE